MMCRSAGVQPTTAWSQRFNCSRLGAHHDDGMHALRRRWHGRAIVRLRGQLGTVRHRRTDGDWRGFAMELQTKPENQSAYHDIYCFGMDLLIAGPRACSQGGAPSTTVHRRTTFETFGGTCVRWSINGRSPEIGHVGMGPRLSKGGGFATG